jgi:sulfur carrier protein
MNNPQTRIASDQAPFVLANGQSTGLPAPCSIEAFLRAHGLVPGTVVVEHNGEAVPPSEFGRRQIESGDRLEIVRIAAGG